jgi:hypothetical protein
MVKDVLDMENRTGKYKSAFFLLLFISSCTIAAFADIIVIKDGTVIFGALKSAGAGTVVYTGQFSQENP